SAQHQRQRDAAEAMRLDQRANVLARLDAAGKQNVAAARQAERRRDLGSDVGVAAGEQRGRQIERLIGVGYPLGPAAEQFDDVAARALGDRDDVVDTLDDGPDQTTELALID